MEERIKADETFRRARKRMEENFIRSGRKNYPITVARPSIHTQGVQATMASDKFDYIECISLYPMGLKYAQDEVQYCI